MSKGTVEFTCGASFETNDQEHAPIGHKVIVYTSPNQGHLTPSLNGKQAPCFCNCPHEKNKRIRTEKEICFNDGSEGFLVTCKIVSCVKKEGNS